MRHYYIVVYQSVANERIMRQVTHLSQKDALSLFDGGYKKILSLTKISRREAKRLGYK